MGIKTSGHLDKFPQTNVCRTIGSLDKWAPNQSCKSGRAFRVGLGFGQGSGRVRARLLGSLRAYFGPNTTLTNKLSKNKIILLPYIYSM